LIGSEKGFEIGILRTEELLRARSVDGAEQYFTRAIDFGYSKSPEESFDIWGKEEILKDVVWVIRKFKPDVIVTDISMPGKRGPEAIRQVKNRNSSVKVLFLTQYTGDDYIYSVLEAGGAGLIGKNVMKTELLHALRIVANGGRYFAGKTDDELTAIRQRFDTLSGEENGKSTNTLTDKEKELLLLISESLSSREIAEKLKISVRTVDAHRTHIIKKMQLKSMPGLILFANDFAREFKSGKH